MIKLTLSSSPLIPTKPLDQVLPPPFMLWWQWAILVITALLTTVVILFLLKKLSKRSSSAKLENPLEVAETQISKLLEKSPQTSEFPVHLSIILREYIYKRFNGKSLFQTKEEINASHLEALDLSKPLKEESLDFINQLDKFKYSQSDHEIAHTEVANTLKMLLIKLDRDFLTLSTEHQKKAM